MRTIRYAMIAALSFLPLHANAEEAMPVLDAWYAALFEVDRTAFSQLLADEAIIKLEDFGIEQTKDEFISALDEWEEAIKDADFAWQTDPDADVNAEEATALVCYRFPTNTLMTREFFRFREGKVIESVQKSIGDSCEDF